MELTCGWLIALPRLSRISRWRWRHHPLLVLPFAILALLLLPGIGQADRLDEVPLEMRAALAVAVCAYPPDQAPMLDPNRPGFTPEAAPQYLQTYRPGELYEVAIQAGGVSVTFTIVQYPNEAVAAQQFAEWQQEWRESVELVNWPEVGLPVYVTGMGLLGVVGEGLGYAGRVQAGLWHFEVSAVAPLPFETKPDREKAAIRANFPKLLEAAQRFRLFPYQLVIEYFPGRGQPAMRLAPNQPFRISLEGLEETRVVFRIYVADAAGQPVKQVPVRYRVRLEGPLAPFAQAELEGSRSLRAEQVFEEARDPVLVKWIFPAVTDATFATALDRSQESGVDVSLDVEARFRPTLPGPPA